MNLFLFENACLDKKIQITLGDKRLSEFLGTQLFSTVYVNVYTL